MRFKLIFWLLCLAISSVQAQIKPETIQPNEKMSAPGTNWFILEARNAAYIFDASNGKMHGLISTSPHTPTIEPNLGRNEFYHADSYYSRGKYGDRTDILTITDFQNLSPIYEINIPNKIAALAFRQYIGSMSDNKHIGISNLTPSQSVSIVNIEKREFITEISTPGCSLILPIDNNGFLTICGDGTLMLVSLDNQGTEKNRLRSEKFFDVHEDAIFDRPIANKEGWTLFSHEGQFFHVSANNKNINIDSPWSLLTESEKNNGWWPGGYQLAAQHKKLNLFYIIMHQGEQYSHHQSGQEVWVFNVDSQRKIATIKFETPLSHIMVTQEENPLLIVGDDSGETHVYDALTFRYQRTIEGPGPKSYQDF